MFEFWGKAHPIGAVPYHPAASQVGPDGRFYGNCLDLIILSALGVLLCQIFLRILALRVINQTGIHSNATFAKWRLWRRNELQNLVRDRLALFAVFSMTWVSTQMNSKLGCAAQRHASTTPPRAPASPHNGMPN
jgi:hypothetical protein